MTTDRVLTLIILLWAILAVLMLIAMGVIPVSAAPIVGGDDTAMTCGVWTYYAAGVAEAVRQNRDIPLCSDCVGLAVTVDQARLGQQIDIRYAGQWVGPFLVVDVGTGHHRPHLVGEVDYPTAMAWHIAGPWWTCYKIMEDS